MYNTPTPRANDADVIVFNLTRWLDKKLGSSMTGLIGPYLEASGIEKVDGRTVRLHLKQATNTLPYDLYNYAGAILPREFEGDFHKQPWGTGPFELVEYVTNERFTLKARKDYWQKGADGQPLPYLDGVISLDVKAQSAAYVAGLVSKQIGVDIKLVPMPPDAYWAKWTDWTFCAPFWGHRPLATMVLGLALRSGAAWNESHYNDKGFDALLDEASAAVSVEDRKKVYAKMEPYLREHGPMAEPFFIFALGGHSKQVQNFKPTAFNYGIFTDTWLA